MKFRWLALLLVALTLIPALGSITAQDDLIPDMQTVEAAVQARFTATAQAQAYSTLALTIDARFAEALTATAQAADSTSTPMPSATTTDYPLTQQAAVMLTPRSVSLESLRLVMSPLNAISGGAFDMGTTPQEVTEAVRLCVDVQQGSCTLEMGEDSLPQHRVTVSPFNLETTEVTNRQYIAFLNFLGPNSHLNGCDGQPCIATQAEAETSGVIYDNGNYRVVQDVLENYPVTHVTWYGANAYCRSMGRRLPTEAEWEHAARGANGFIYPWGNEWNPDLARTSIPATDEIGPVAVGSYPLGASAFGALDMAGNVAEWVSDWYAPTYYLQQSQSAQMIIDPQGPPSGVEKVIRGGSWDAKPFFARSVHRQSLDPTGSGAWLGFRCAADFSASPAPTVTSGS